MKYRISSCVTLAVFAVLATSVRLASQEQRTELQHRKEHHRYRLVDIGTFGGPEGFVNPDVNGGNAISKRGAAVGSSATPIPKSPTSVACGGLDGTLPFVFHAFKSQGGVVTDLGTLPGDDNCSVATSSNVRGEIVGLSENGVIDPVTSITEFRAVLWKHDEIEDLGTLGGIASSASQINDRNQVTGSAYNAIPDPFTPLGTQIRAFLWEDGHMRDLGTLGGPDVIGSFINESGQIAGLSLINSIPNPSTGIPTQDPFLWENGEMIDIGTLGGVAGGPSALNNRGQVVGQSSDAADPAACFVNDTENCHPFLWDDGRLTDLNTHTIGGNPLTARAINDAGEIVGAACFPSVGCSAYLWRDGVATDLGALPGDCFSEAFAINARAQVVGQSFSCSGFGRLFLWENGSMIDLNSFVPPGSGLQLAEAIAINDRGEIAGDLLPPGCTDDTQCGHAFVLIPCHDDHSGEAGCEDEDEVTTSATQNSSMTANKDHLVNSMNRVLTPREIMSRTQSRFGWIRGFWASPQK